MPIGVRPVFKDRILHERNGSDRAQFDISSPFLPVLNNVKQDGTFMTAGQMNNTLYPSNLASFGGANFTVDLSDRNNPKMRIWDIVIDDYGVSSERTILEAELVYDSSSGKWDYTDRLYDTVYDEALGVEHHTLVQERRGEVIRSGRILTGRML